MPTWLTGKKTYIVAVLMIGYGVALILQGQTEQGIAIILSALGLGALRSGITNA